MLKPTSHMAIDSSKADPRRMKVLEEILYGTDKFEAQLPYPGEILDLFSNDPALGIYQEPEHPDNNLLPRGVSRRESDLHRTTVDTGDRYETGETIWESEKTSTAGAPINIRSVDLTTGTTYTLSVWAKTTTPNTGVYIGFYLRDVGFLSSYTQKTLSQDWQRWHVTVTVDSDLPSDVDMYFYPFGTKSSEPGAKTQWTSPKLEYGTVATPWPPTPYSVSGYSDIHYSTGTDLRGFKDEGIYTIHENSKLTEQGVGLYGL